MKQILTLLLCLGILNESMATSFSVTNLSDAGAGSLRQAIISANADGTATGGAPHIISTSLTGTVTLVSGLPALSNHITITAPVAGGFIVNGVSGASVFAISASYTVILNTLTIQGGSGTTLYGGGVNNAGTLTLNNCTISGNSLSTTGQGAGIYNASGATLNVNACTISGNNASNNGGGIANYGTATLVNCTIYNNLAGMGAAVMNYMNLTLTNCSVVNNTGGGIYHASGGGTLGILNTLLIGSSGTTDDLDTDAVSPISVGSAYSVYGSVNANIAFVGVSNTSGSSPVAIYGTVTLANNGGPTNTIAIPGTSYAVNNGTATSAPTTDQRGLSRSGATDIGSFEYHVATTTLNSLPADAVTIYSNPGNGMFYAEAGSSINGPFEWKVMDNNGRLVESSGMMSKNSDTEKFAINITGKPAGIYYLIFTANDGTLTKAIIKQ